MNYFLDITVHSAPDNVPEIVLGNVVDLLHKSLSRIGLDAVGVDFPRYTLHTLGDVVRVFAQDKETLAQLDIYRLLFPLSDYLNPSRIQSVPAEVSGHAMLYRVIERNTRFRARRYAHRHGLNVEQTFAEFNKNRPEPELTLPKLKLFSEGSKRMYRMFIRQDVHAAPSPGRFNHFGLSKTATVPVF